MIDRSSKLTTFPFSRSFEVGDRDPERIDLMARLPAPAQQRHRMEPEMLRGYLDALERRDIPAG
jgi:hypothetical protein